jgi:hypothetical protein
LSTSARSFCLAEVRVRDVLREDLVDLREDRRVVLALRRGDTGKQQHDDQEQELREGAKARPEHALTLLEIACEGPGKAARRRRLPNVV